MKGARPRMSWATVVDESFSGRIVEMVKVPSPQAFGRSIPVRSVKVIDDGFAEAGQLLAPWKRFRTIEAEIEQFKRPRYGLSTIF
jgi:hypothetical protein